MHDTTSLVELCPFHDNLVRLLSHLVDFHVHLRYISIILRGSHLHLYLVAIKVLECLVVLIPLRTSREVLVQFELYLDLAFQF